MNYKYVKISFRVPVIDDEFNVVSRINQFFDFTARAIFLIFNVVTVTYEYKDEE